MSGPKGNLCLSGDEVSRVHHDSIFASRLSLELRENVVEQAKESGFALGVFAGSQELVPTISKELMEAVHRAATQPPIPKGVMEAAHRAATQPPIPQEVLEAALLGVKPSGITDTSTTSSHVEDELDWIPDWVRNIESWLVYVTFALQVYSVASQSEPDPQLIRKVRQIDERTKKIENTLDEVGKGKRGRTSNEKITVVTTRVEVQVRPDSQSLVSEVLYPNDVVEPVAVDSSWSQVRFERRLQGKVKEGWVPNKVLRVLEE